MHNQALISIIIPAYNHERCIEDTIRSIWDQSAMNLEIIVIDDGSSDGTLSVARRLQQQSPVPMSVFHQENQGITRTLNKSLSLCSGKYVAVIASDDMFMPQRFDQQLARLEADPLVQVVWSNGLTWTDGIPGSRMHQPDIIEILGKTPPEVLKYIYTNVSTFFTQTALFRRSLLENINGWDATLKLDDWPLNARIFTFLVHTGQTHEYIDTDVVYYRQVPESLSHNIRKQSQGFITALEKYVPSQQKEEVLAETYWMFGMAALYYGEIRLGLRYLWISQRIQLSLHRITRIIMKLFRYPFKKLFAPLKGTRQ